MVVWMLIRGLLILLFSTPFSLNLGYLQAQTNIQSIVVECQMTPPVRDTIAAIYRIPLEAGCFADVIDQLSSNLAPQQVQLSDNTSSTKTQIDITLRYDADIHGVPLIQLTILPEVSTLPSPILAPHPHSVWFYANSPSARKTIADFLSGIVFYAQGNCESAKQFFTLAQENYSEDDPIFGISDLIFYRGNCALISEDFELAAELFESELIFDDSSLPTPESSMNLAWTYLQLNQEDMALALMDELVAEAAPDDSDGPYRLLVNALEARAQIQALTFDYDAAITDLDDAIDIAEDHIFQITQPRLAELYVQRAQHILLIYEWDRVLADYNTAIELAPDYADAYYHRGLLFYTQGVREDALTDFAHYLELAPDGEFADDAAQYIADIETQLSLLNE
ncbi:MAG: tetratricopeptide repeat protein [Chloroflexi bacterium]|nr:MAG: hypothetical protein CUN54_01115 [Phototrophicales bacterium]RMF78126.1 MAG: tetratricopeptide repeat protein [Chloroflexota bacterium]